MVPLLLLGALGAGAEVTSAQPGPTLDGAEAARRRGLAYLAAEVPRWSREEGCFSCHNNGDGARALLLAPEVGAEPLHATLGWLARPDDWTKADAEAPFRDDRLARLQFTLALQAATSAGRIADREPLVRAADRLAADQRPDGSWPIDEAAPIGSPATYGPALATALARRALAEIDAARFAGSITRADRWLIARPIRNVPEAAAHLIAQPEGPTARAAAIALIQHAQNDDGGWGPYPRSPTEAFDTALALIALSGGADRVPVVDAIARGRRALVASQENDGRWPATTRPAGGLSYAQQVSTTAWAVLALGATEARAGAEAPRR